MIWHGGRPRLQPGTALLVKPADLQEALHLMAAAGLKGRHRAALLALLALVQPATNRVYERNGEILKLAGYSDGGVSGSGHAHGALQQLQAVGLITRAMDPDGRACWLVNPLLASRPAGSELVKRQWEEFSMWQLGPESAACVRARLDAMRARKRQAAAPLAEQYRDRQRERRAKVAATTEPLPAAA